MLAYVFWHRPREGVAASEYVASLQGFHDRIGVPSWFTALERPPWTDEPGWYEDWYLVDSWSGLGRLNDAAVSGARREPHEAAARRTADGIAGIYALRAGRPAKPAWAAWLHKPRDLAYEDFDAELRAAAGQGSSLWQRQMTLGPTPEFALLGPAAALLPWPAVETGPN